MNPRTTALLALVALVLGAFVYFYEIEGESARQAAVEDEKRLHPGLSPDRLDAIELTSEDGVEARFERRDGRWWVVRPVVDRADATALDAIASALTNLPREGRVPDAASLEPFGLAEGARVVRFEVDGESMGVRIGKSTPVGGNVYVARLGDDEVAYVETYRLNPLKRAFGDLRDRRLFEFEAGEVRTLRVVWPDVGAPSQVALARDDTEAWRMGEPVVGRGDEQTLRTLLSDLAFLRAKAFVDERTDEVEDALDANLVTLYWTLPGDHVERRLRIAGVLEGGRLVEAPDGRLYVIDVERVEDFPRSVDAYRDKMLSEFEIAAARRWALEFADEGEGATRIEATLGEGGWDAGDTDFDPDRASDMVRRLSSLRASEIVADEMGEAELASLGLAPPRVRVRIEGEASADEPARFLADVAIGRLDADRGLFAQRVGDPRVFLLPASVADSVPVSRSAWREEFVAQPESAVDEREAEGLEADPLEGVEIP